MWVRIQPRDEACTQNLLSLPQRLAGKLPGVTELCFGLSKTVVRIATEDDIPYDNTSYDEPLALLCSGDIIDALHIPTSLVYRLEVRGNLLTLGPVIGLLLGEQRYYYHDRFMREFTDTLNRYRDVGGLVIAFKQQSIDWDKRIIYGLYYDGSSGCWKYGMGPLPSVVFRRAFRGTEETAALLSQRGTVVVNSTRLDKWQVYEHLKDHPVLKRYLPETAELQQTEVLDGLLAKYPQLILKPRDLSRGRGICIVKRNPSGSFTVNDCTEGRSGTLTLEQWELHAYLRYHRFFEQNYILQQFIPLATINGSPWDIRVVMQKNLSDRWVCHGIECRLAGTGELLTNISRGGQALYLNQAVRLAFGSKVHPGRFKDEVVQIAESFCKALEVPGERFCEFGLDLAVDTGGNFWFIEANVRPSFNGFKRLDYNNYLTICAAPVQYAAALAGFGKEV